ncbi:MAG TPA: HEAT repeat domain-containing protein [Terriglobales bacterium]|nr:HEAT repeat domain-containing protein [Terriglobales bacterium]
MGPAQNPETQSPAVRAFLRSLNTLLKSARIYGTAHAQTVAQSGDAWKHLQAVFSDGRKNSLQLAVSENRLLIDSFPVKGGPTEQAFAQFLAAADLASVTFTSQATEEAFREMVRIFGESGSKPEGLAEKLKEALGDETRSGIRINEVRFVPADSEGPEKSIAIQLLAQTLGGDPSQMQGLLDDPLKLLELITAAESDTGPAGPHSTAGAETGPSAAPEAATASAGRPTAPAEQTEEETAALIHLLGELARVGKGESVDPAKLRGEFSGLPQSSRETLRQVLAEFAQSLPKKAVGTPLLLQLAEHLAVQLALDRYQKGDARVDAVTEMLNRLNREVDSLRKTLGSYEEKLEQARSETARPPDSLEEQFWGGVPESARLDVLLSDQAWRVPTHCIRQYLDRLAEPSDAEKVQQILVNYASCIHNSSPEAQQKTALGLKDLAAYYPRPEGPALRIAIGHVGEELAKEHDPRFQNLISATFVLLAQDAATRRRYPAILQMMFALESVEKVHPEVASSLRARVGLANRVPDFLEEMLRVGEPSGDLIEVLRRMPQAAAEHLAGKVSRCAQRRERDRVVALAEELGPAAAHALRDAFRLRPPAAAVIIVGLLSRLDPAALEEVLLPRLREWTMVYQDAVVRHIAGAGSPGRGLLLANLLDAVDPVVVPLALDEIGMSGDKTPVPLLLEIAAGNVPRFAAPLLRIKALEALGRLRVKDAIPLLRQLVESEEFLDGRAPRELRVVAAGSLLKIDPEGAKEILSGAGFEQADLEPMPFDPNKSAPGIRQRYYPRVKLPRAVPARITTADGEFLASVPELSLGGGICSCERRLFPGIPATVRIKSGLRSIAAKSFLRDARSERIAFEIIDIDLEDRGRLRALLQAAGR